MGRNFFILANECKIVIENLVAANCCMKNFEIKVPYLKWRRQQSWYYEWGGVLKYDLGRDVLLRLEKQTHFYSKVCQKNETHFCTWATNFKQVLLKISHFPKLLRFQANFRYFGIRLMKYYFQQILNNFEYTRSLYQETDFGPISVARARIDRGGGHSPEKGVWGCAAFSRPPFHASPTIHKTPVEA